MTRHVFLGNSIPTMGEASTVLTPNENAAAALNVKHLSLDNMARMSLVGKRVANPVEVSRLSRAAVEATFNVSDPAGVARALLPPVREVLRSGADVDADPGSSRARRVFGMALAYRSLLRVRGLVDPAEAVREAAGCSPPKRPLRLYGYPRLGADETAFLDAVAADGSEVYLPYAEDSLFAENLRTAEELCRRGWRFDKHPAASVWTVDEGVSVDAQAYPHREAEVRGALAQIKELLADGANTEEIVLVSRDDSGYGPTVLAVAQEYGVPVRALYRVPLTETRLGSWLSRLLEASASRFPFEETAHLLRHPIGPGLSSERWSAARASQASGVEGWAEVDVDLADFALSSWPAEDVRAGWVKRTEAFLRRHGLEDRANAWPREAVALSHLEDALGWLASPEDERVPRAGFLRELSELLPMVTTPEQPEGRGVALHTPLSLFGARYRYVFAVGLVEGEFPAHVGDDPVLDFHERKLLRARGIGLELAAERGRRERLSFHELLKVPTERLTLSRPRLIERREALPSPYFGMLGLEAAPPKRLPVASVEEARRIFLPLEDGRYVGDPVVEGARGRWRVELKREGSRPFDAHDGALGIPVVKEGSFSVSELGDLARCGFRWWSGRVLGLREPEEGESPAVLGNIKHLALELAVRCATESGANGERLRAAVLERLEGCFEEAERRYGAHRILRSWALRRGEHLRRLRRAVEGEEFLLPGAEVVGTEVRFEGEWRGLPVRGRLDRVDRTPQGAVLVDYKSGSGASLPRPDFQLVVYEEAAAPDLFPATAVEGAYYYSLSKGERIRLRKPEEGEREATARRMEGALVSGRLVPDALEHDPRGQVCEHCAFDLVCRRGPRLRSKPVGEA